MKTIEAPVTERDSTPIFAQLREEFGFTQIIADIVGEAGQAETAEQADQTVTEPPESVVDAEGTVDTEDAAAENADEVEKVEA